MQRAADAWLGADILNVPALLEGATSVVAVGVQREEPALVGEEGDWSPVHDGAPRSRDHLKGTQAADTPTGQPANRTRGTRSVRVCLYKSKSNMDSTCTDKSHSLSRSLTSRRFQGTGTH
eukprot:GHVU01090851.1.p2 GENE.GHVU01090851.1~~GHVU01090851.1.p2  ORF type:complete len:120 (-),score=7.11 GHVU01090851.1:601-960(-)